MSLKGVDVDGGKAGTNVAERCNLLMEMLEVAHRCCNGGCKSYYYYTKVVTVGSKCWNDNPFSYGGDGVVALGCNRQPIFALWAMVVS